MCPPSASHSFFSLWSPTRIECWAAEHLRAACYRTDRTQISTLLMFEGFPFAAGPGGKTPLHLAAMSKNPDVINLLCQRALKFLESFYNQHKEQLPLEPPHSATCPTLSNSLSTPPLLLQNASSWARYWLGELINQMDASEQTPLHLSCRKNSPAIALTLMYWGANPYLKDQFGQTPFTLTDCPACRQALHWHPEEPQHLPCAY